MTASKATTGEVTRPLLVVIEGHKVLLTPHAQQRYWDRIQPSLADISKASDMLRLLVKECGKVTSKAPAWHKSAPRHVGDKWLVFTDGNGGSLDFALPLEDEGKEALNAPTLLVKGGPTDAEWQRKTRERKELKRARKAKRKGSTYFNGQDHGPDYNR